jgi:hypothetical protein
MAQHYDLIVIGSPVYCASARGYYEGAVEMMGAPGPIVSSESLCQCGGDPWCAFDLSW